MADALPERHLYSLNSFPALIFNSQGRTSRPSSIFTRSPSRQSPRSSSVKRGKRPASRSPTPFQEVSVSTASLPYLVDEPTCALPPPLPSGTLATNPEGAV